jgi:hypothetical protein
VRQGYYFIPKRQQHKIDFTPSMGYITGTNRYQTVHTSKKIQYNKIILDEVCGGYILL